MNFKELVQQDNRTTFLNPDEFGEEKIIDGNVVIVVVDNDLTNERPRLVSAGEDIYANGVFRSTITFFVRKEELGYVPEEGQPIRFGEVGQSDYPYFVSNVSESMGILEITIEANRT